MPNPTTSQVYSVLIIGSGFGGQAAAFNLNKLGITDYVILERRPFLGGTWSQNNYPGAAVDVQSPLYSLSFEPYAWSQMFADQHELTVYTNKVLDKYKIREKAILDADVTALNWDDQNNYWKVTTSNKGVFLAKCVISAAGPLSNPKFPNFKGADTFKGVSFHTNAWNHNYDYKGKRVAVIGMGASSAQVIPAIAPDVKHMDVFIRTPHWVMPRPDYTFSPLQRKLLGLKPVHKAIRTSIYWSLEARVLGLKYSKKLLTMFAQQHAESYLERKVPDPELRKKLTPDYTIGCKRIILSSTILPALSRSNVTVHDKTDAIAEVTPTGVKTQQGKEIELDAIIYATGYDATDNPVSFAITGRGGKPLGDFWGEYARAYLGTSMPDFPNLFLTVGPNTGIGHTSALFIIESQIQYMMDCIKRVVKEGATAIEPTHGAEAEYTAMIHREMKRTVWQNGGCNSWYKNRNGYVIAMFPGFSFTYRLLTKNFKPHDHKITA